MYVKVVAERPQTVSDVAVAINQLIATCCVDGHVTSSPAHAVTVTASSTVLLYQPSDVLHQEPVQLV